MFWSHLKKYCLNGFVQIVAEDQTTVRSLRLCKYKLKEKKNHPPSLAHIFSPTCALRLVPRVVSEPNNTGWGICSTDWRWEFCLEFEGVIFPMAWFVWHPPVPFPLQGKAWEAIVADDVKRALRLAGSVTFGPCLGWCGFTSHLQSLSRSPGPVLQWVLLVGWYIFSKASESPKEGKESSKADSWREQSTLGESSGTKKDQTVQSLAWKHHPSVQGRWTICTYPSYSPA